MTDNQNDSNGSANVDTGATNGAPLGAGTKNGAVETASPASTEAEAKAERPEIPSSKPELPSDEMSFAEMFALAEKQIEEKKKKRKAEGQSSSLRPGQIIEARIVSLSHDSVFLDVGAKAEGVIPKGELMSDDGEFALKEGDKVEVRVRKFEGPTVVFTKVLPHQSLRNREQLREAQQAGLPVEGKVTSQNKGGYEVEIAGMRAFCPASQMDFRPSGRGEDYIGKKFPFRIVELKDGGRNIVLSRRQFLMEERAKQAEELLSKIEVGGRVKGIVTTLKDYGAFVDLGGLEGLVHLSEISHGHINKPGSILKVGDEVETEILKIEDGKDGQKKISLSIKATTRDPWESARAVLKEGEKVTGKIARIQPFGAFVEIMPGVDGLIHVSNMALGRRIKDPREVVKEGDEVEATVVSVDWDKRRVGLSLVKTPTELADELGVGSVHEGVIDRIEGFGLFVKLPSGARGLVPSAETGTQRGADLTKEFNVGSKVKVSVLEVDGKSGKIRLSIRAASEAEERAEYAGYMSSGKSSGSGLGTLGDLFKAKLGDLKNATERD